MTLLNQAWQELRQHPGRFWATGLAIAISVAFLAATSVFSSTESHAVVQRQVLYAGQADIVGQSTLWHSPGARGQRDEALSITQKLLEADPRVASVDTFSQLFGRISSGDAVAGVLFTSIPSHDELRWFTPAEGRLPTSATEVMISRSTAAELGVGLGSVITVAVKGVPPLTVVGLTSERGYADPPAYVLPEVIEAADAGFPPPSYGLMVPQSDQSRRTTPGSTGDGVGIWLLIKLKQPGDVAAVVSSVQEELKLEGVLRILMELKPASQVRQEAIADGSGATAAMTGLLAGAGGLALVVGALIIGTTFTLLMAQQRRQVGLLRAVGASRGQVLVRSGSEALILGGLGTLVGLPVGVAAGLAVCRWGTGATDFGVQIPWLRLAVIGVLGVVVTVMAALFAIAQATRVRPLEALQPAPPPQITRRHRVRGMLLSLAGFALGLASIWDGLFGTPQFAVSQRAWWTLAGISAVGLAVLASTWLWVPVLVRLLGAPLRWARPASKLGLANTVRNPGRTGATTTALLLAVGLIIAVQVGSPSALASAQSGVDQRYRADIAAIPTIMRELSDPGNGNVPDYADVDENGLLKGFAPSVLSTVKATPGVADAAMYRVSQPVPVETMAGIHDQVVFGELPSSASGLLASPVSLAPGQVGVSSEDLKGLSLIAGQTLTVVVPDAKPLRLTVVELNLTPELLVVHPQTLAQIGGPMRPGLLLVKLTDADQAAGVMDRLTVSVTKANSDVQFSGGAEIKANLAAKLSNLSLIATALLAITAAVALLGVGNTLGLSVLERTRESALLRALGLQRRGLRWMLLVEALLVGAVAVLVGVIGGAVVGWLGAATAAQRLSWPRPGLQVSWPAVVFSCLAVLVASALASILPGRRAALAAPVDALADLG